MSKREIIERGARAIFAIDFDGATGLHGTTFETLPGHYREQYIARAVAVWEAFAEKIPELLTIR